jgi:hypothetical protein
MKFIFLITIVVAFTATLFSQQGNDTLASLNKRFLSFEYEKAISVADSLLKYRENYSKDILLDIYRIKGISHFSLLEDAQSEESFVNILKIDSSYLFDTARTSPKIIAFYNNVKDKYSKELQNEARQKIANDTIYITKTVIDPEAESKVKNSVYRSIILPGWGHLYTGESAKGIILASLGSVTLLSSIYFIIDSNQKEDDYKKSKNILDISHKYDKYNKSYKIKNYSLIAFSAVWLYTQIDLLFISHDKEIKNKQVIPEINTSGSTTNLSIKFVF